MSNGDHLTLRSTITADLQRFILIRGTFLGGLGGVILLQAGTWVPADTLQYWGLPLLALSLALITWGLLPYQQLRRLGVEPYKLIVTDEELQFLRGADRQFTIPVSAIEKLYHRNEARDYGICIELKNAPDAPVIVHTPKIDIDRLRAQTRKRYGCDLYLPYFSERSFRRLQPAL